MKPIRSLIAVAQGFAPADTAVVNAQVFNVYTGSFATRDILVAQGYIAAVLPPGSPAVNQARHVVDAVALTGSGEAWITPGFIDSHVHMESSMLSPQELAAVLAANGVTTLVADPHEIANAAGAYGIQYMLEATQDAHARVFIKLPSCVPAGPLEKSKFSLNATDLIPFFGHDRVLGLGEVMNYPGVLSGYPEVMEKLEAIQRYSEEHFGPFQGGMSVDGHSPLLFGDKRQAYAAAGILSDHEASSPEEASQMLAAGMALMLREGSAAKNLLDLVPAVTEHTARRCMLCTDDRNAEDLAHEGSINHLVRLLASDGRLPLPVILNMASRNAAEFFALRDIGAIAPGFRADFALYGDQTSWKPDAVWRDGLLVASKGEPAFPPRRINADALRGSVRLAAKISERHFAVPDTSRPVHIIEIIPGQILTRDLAAALPAKNGLLQADPEHDIARLAVLDRYQVSGNIGLGFVKGLGLREGAIASTVAHDAHNLVVAGMNEADMASAALALERSGGGLAVCRNGGILAILPLPLAGILSDQPISSVRKDLRHLREAVSQLGPASDKDPFMILSFLCLTVIPSLKLSADGLVDVNAFAFTSLYA